MVLILALFECGLLCASSWATIHFLSGLHAGFSAPGTGLSQSLLLSMSCALAFYAQHLYDLRAVRTFREFLRRLPLTGALAFLLTLVLWRLLDPEGARALSPLLVLATVLALLLPVRALVYGAALRPLARRNLLLGTGPLARQIAHELESGDSTRDLLVGVVAESVDDLPPATKAPVFGTLEDLGTVLSRTSPTRIIVALEERRGRLPARRLLEARVRGVAVQDGAQVLEELTGKIAIESVSPGSLAFSGGFGATGAHELLARVTSFLLGAAGLVVTAPLLLLIALVVKLDSRGPVLFVQERIGLGGRRFRLLKFRSMHAAKKTTTEWARDNEERITRAGRWLRRFRLDELPQFVNILRGDLNLIGPRPHPASNFDLFNRIVPYYWLRSLVRPGVTGWAQVRYGYANDLEQETEKMRYDLYYLKHRSIALDLRILFDTAGAVLLGRGAGAAASGLNLQGLDRAVARVPHLLLRRDSVRTSAARGAAFHG